jgi:hypothetical protein
LAPPVGPPQSSALPVRPLQSSVRTPPNSAPPVQPPPPTSAPPVQPPSSFSTRPPFSSTAPTPPSAGSPHVQASVVPGATAGVRIPIALGVQSPLRPSFPGMPLPLGTQAAKPADGYFNSYDVPGLNHRFVGPGTGQTFMGGIRPRTMPVPPGMFRPQMAPPGYRPLHPRYT